MRKFCSAAASCWASRPPDDVSVDALDEAEAVDDVESDDVVELVDDVESDDVVEPVEDEQLSPVVEPVVAALDPSAAGGGPGGGGGGALWAMASNPLASSETESVPSPLASRLAKALARLLAADVEALEVVVDAVPLDAEPPVDTPSALSMSDRLSVSPPLGLSWLIRSEARVVAAESRLEEALAEPEDEVEAVDEVPPAASCAEVRADNVSELKRSDGPAPDGMGGGPGGGPANPAADWEESA